MRQAGSKGSSLVGMLAAVAVIAIAAAFILPHYLGGSTPDGKTVRAPIAAAHDTECQANLRSVRQSIQVFRTGDTDEKNPGSLDELRELPSSVRRCPVGGEAYVYDPATGSVHCPHPGHETY
jgi:hypothetical protein